MNSSFVVNKRARAILTIVIVMLVALLAALVVVFYNVLQPAGLPDSASKAPTGLVWVRSMYGFGPSADEQLKAPTSVAVAPNGDIYAADPSRSRVMVFRSDGTFKRLLHTGAGGTGPGQFVRPESLDVDDEGYVFIADSWAKKVVVMNAAGEFVREFAVDQQARGVCVDADKVYVLDIGHVIVFDKQGNRIGAFGVRGAKPGQLDAYQGIVARDGKVFVADAFNKRLQRFTQTGELDWAVPGGIAERSVVAGKKAGSDESSSAAVPDHRWDLPQDLVFDGRGRLVVIDAFRFEIAVVDPDTGKAIAQYGEFGALDGQLFYPSSIDYDPVRDWFVVADTQNNRVQIVTIPNSGRPGAAMVWRATASPFRYLAVPVALLVLALALTVWSLKRYRARMSASAATAGMPDGATVDREGFWSEEDEASEPAAEKIVADDTGEVA